MRIENNLEQRICFLIETTLGIKGVNIDSSQENFQAWDSLGYLSVLSAIEDEFQIDINQDNINNFGTVENIITEINGK